jgi:UDP-N-acetylmuramate--alanine ligase
LKAVIIEKFGPPEVLQIKETDRPAFKADELLVTAIYPAGEAPIEGIAAENMAEEIKHHGHKNVRYFADQPSIISYLQDNLRDDQLLVTLGAGDVNKIGHMLVAS